MKTKEEINYLSKLIEQNVWRLDPHGQLDMKQTDLICKALAMWDKETLENNLKNP